MSNDERPEASHAYGFELPMLLFAGFRSIIDELHAELARCGHPDLRPAHGFALQAIGHGGATAAEAGRRLAVLLNYALTPRRPGTGPAPRGSPPIPLG